MHSTDNLEDGYLGSGKLLSHSIKKYGRENHRLSILETCNTRSELALKEKNLIHEGVLLDPLCMNLTVGGEGGPIRKGKTHTPEAKEKIRQALLGHSHSEETKAKIGLKSLGRGKGRTFSPEQREKLSLSKKGKVSSLRGKVRPLEVGKKISEALTKRFLSHPRPKRPPPPPIPVEVTRERLSRDAKEQWANPEMRRRMMEAREKVEEELKFYCDDQRHLVCLPYSIHNLHRAGRELGISRCWYHSSKDHPHYDIPKRRIAEIQTKCTVVSSRDILAIIKGTYNVG